MISALLARVRFASGDAPALTLLVIKPALVPGLPADVVRYAQSSPRFPQEPTADQFFDEAQWESYRRLGEAVGGALFAAQPEDDGWTPASLRPLPDGDVDGDPIF